MKNLIIFVLHLILLREFKSERMKWEEDIGRVGKKINTYMCKILLGEAQDVGWLGRFKIIRFGLN
jgi:hypothetical protein